MRMQKLDQLMCRARRLAGSPVMAIAGLLVIVAALASCAQPGAIIRPALPEPAKSSSPPELVAPEPVIVTRLGPDSGANPAPNVASTVQPPTARQAHIALIIPANSRDLAAAADAVKQGFTAGAQAEGAAAPPFRIYPSDNETNSLAAQYRKAVQEGAIVLVGGITRDGATTMAKEAGLLPTLALNAPAETELPDRFFYITLNVDAEVRQQARSAAQEGFRRAALLVGNTQLARRIQETFEREWTRMGGQIAARITLSGDASTYTTTVQAAMERAHADMAFFAADSGTARSARPYLPTGMPVFATSHSLDARAEPVQNVDLESVHFLEMPWFVEKDHPAVMAYAKPASNLPLDYERLYALGIDAWRLSQTILKSDRARDIAPLDGVTGKLTLDGAQFVRTLTPVEMRDGVPFVFRPGE